MAEIINGKEISKAIREEISSRVKNLSAKNIIPGLAVILVGDDPASNVYVNMKEKACVNVGINSFVNRLPADISQKTVLDLIKEFNEDDKVHGILIQHPLPPAMDEPYVFGKVDPQDRDDTEISKSQRPGRKRDSNKGNRIAHPPARRARQTHPAALGE